MKYRLIDRPDKEKRVDRHLHSVFFEYFGRVIYDGIWVGKDSPIPNTDGLRQDVIDGCRELGVGAMRWPVGCCADHYHWRDGVGADRSPRLHPIPEPANPVWRHEFGTDEFLRLCELTGADPVITVNTATGTPQEFLDWYEYINGDARTRYGQMRAANGHPEPYNVYYWALGNADENIWHVDFNDPESYARRYRQFQTVIRNLRKDLYVIGLGLSTRHKLPGWVGKSLDYLTHGQQLAETNFKVDLNGEGSSAQLMSRSVAKGESRQVFRSQINGNAKCSAHSECDAIIMDSASVSAIPEVTANHLDAALIHEAAIGKIAGEQLIKLMTLGLTEQEAEEQIVNGFLK